MIKKGSVLLFFLISTVTIMAQRQLEGSTKGRPVDVGDAMHEEEHGDHDHHEKSTKIGYYVLYQDNLDTLSIPVDTALRGFHNYNEIFRRSISNTYLGNYGTPYISNIYQDRRPSEFIFSDVFREYLIRPEDVPVMNTRTPFTLLSYGTGGKKQVAEESVSVMFAQNAGKAFNVGGYFDLIYAREVYDNLASNNRNYGGFASYISPKYTMRLNAGSNSVKTLENGGIGDADGWLDAYVNEPYTVTDELGASQTENYPVRMSADTKLKRNFIQLHNKYNLGVVREVEDADSTKDIFIPALNLVHQFSYESNVRQYYGSHHSSYYDTAYINAKTTSDTLRQRKISNRIGVYLDEEINTFAKFGLGAYLQMDNYKLSTKSWHQFPDTTMQKPYSEAKTSSNFGIDSLRYLGIQQYTPYTYNNVIFGGSAFKRQGTHFFFDASGRICLGGYNAGDWQLEGTLKQVFPKMGDWELSANANFERITPAYHYNQFYSNNFWWDNNFAATYKQHIGGYLKIPALSFEASASVDNMQNVLYFDVKAQAAQNTSNMAILTVDVKKDFNIGNHLVWENNVVYQETSSQSTIPLPRLTAYSNLFFKHILFEVLHFNLGVDCRYHTAYYAPGWMPALGQFYNQDEVQIGDYPYMNAYADFFLRRMRFYLMAQHVNYGWPSLDYFSAPHYGYKHRMFKLGLQWTFYD